MCPDIGDAHVEATQYVLIPLISGHVSGQTSMASINWYRNVLIPLISGHVSGPYRDAEREASRLS